MPNILKAGFGAYFYTKITLSDIIIMHNIVIFLKIAPIFILNCYVTHRYYARHSNLKAESELAARLFITLL